MNQLMYFLGEKKKHARSEHLGSSKKHFNFLNHNALFVPISILKQPTRNIQYTHFPFTSTHGNKLMASQFPSVSQISRFLVKMES